MITSPDKIKINYVLRFEFKAFINKAEYEALIARLKMSRSVRAELLKVNSDS